MASALELISATTLSATSTVVSFTGIPSTYTDLRVYCAYRTIGNGYPSIYFNSDSSTNYSYNVWYQINTSAGDIMDQYSGNAYARFPAGFTDVGIYDAKNVVLLDVFNYTNSFHKNAQCHTTQPYDRFPPSGPQNEVVPSNGIWFCTWMSTSAITSISFTLLGSNMGPGTKTALYGIKALS